MTLNDISTSATCDLNSYSTRVWRKINSGFALVAYYTLYTAGSYYTGPILIAKQKAAGSYQYVDSGTAGGTVTAGHSLSYQGSWYYTPSGAWLSGTLTLSGTYTYNLGTCSSEEEAAKKLIDLYYKLLPTYPRMIICS